ncbi:MAG: SMI1/KNR4 family protein [Deltaproteobacteria bacterium]|nr:SMI1/KNR4 family protein [Deltaproteobacteria bacterium]
MNSDLLPTLALTFQARATQPAGGVDLATLQEFEAQHGVNMPDELRAYFLTVNGMVDSNGDSELYLFLPLKDLRPRSETPGLPSGRNDRLFIIVDYMISSWFYAIDLNEGPTWGAVFWDVGPDDLHLRWPSFAEFITDYIRHPDGLLR